MADRTMADKTGADKTGAEVKSCLIVAAGKGTRIKGLGDLKPMVNLGGKPLIEHAISAARSAGVEHFVVITGYKAELLQTFLQDLARRENLDIRAVFNPDFERENGLSVLAGAPWLDSSFYLAMCDHLVEPSLYEKLASADLPEGAVGLGVDLDMGNPDVDLEDVTKVFLEEGNIREIGKDLTVFNAYDCGIFRAGPALFAAIREAADKHGDCSISGGMRLLTKAGLAKGIEVTGAKWFDVDSLDMHERATAWYKNRHASVVKAGTEKTVRKIVAVGHRGAKKFAPENTLVAHEAAFAMGARAVEFDIRCTKDGEFVLIHDATVNRTTNGRGKVKDMTLAEIKALDAGSYMGPQYKDVRIPTLREALRNVKGRYVVDIDFKGGPKNSAEILHRVLHEEGFDRDGEPLVTIFCRWFHFGRLIDLAPKYAVRPHFISNRRTRQISANHKLEIMGLRRFSFSQKAARAIRENDMHLFCNVMGREDNEKAFDECVKAGALFIQTDHIDRLVRYLDTRGLLERGVLGRDYKGLPGSVAPPVSTKTTQTAVQITA